MSQLPSKLKHKLNTMLHELGDWKLGNVLQECLDEINGNSSGGLVMTKYASTAAYEAANGNQKTNGGFFVNSTTNNIMYCCNGEYFEIDLASIQAQITANAECCALNAADIININAAVSALQDAFTSHNHDGVNSPRIEAKTLLATGELNGSVLTVNNGVVTCTVIEDTQDIFLEGVLIEGSATGLNFIDDCFNVTTVNGVAQISIPSFKTALTNIQANADCCAANTASIIALGASLATTVTNVLQNATDILNLTQIVNDLVNNGQITDPTVGLLSTGIADCQLLASDGNGNVIWKDPATLMSNAIICGKNTGDATSTELFIQVDPVDGCLEFRKLAGGCGIALTTDVNNNVVIDIDFANMQNIGTAVDPLNDLILVHDVSTGDCVTTSLNNLIPAPASIVGGKMITTTVTGTDTTLDVDLSSVTVANTLQNIDAQGGYFIAYNPVTGDCERVLASDFSNALTFVGGKLTNITQTGGTVNVDVDLSTVAGADTLSNLEANGGYVIAYDPAINDCVRINISEFLLANLGVTGGKLLTAVTTGNQVTLDIDLTSVTAVSALSTLQTNGGFLLGYDPATGDCTRLNVTDIPCAINDLKDVCIEAESTVLIGSQQLDDSQQMINAFNPTVIVGGVFEAEGTGSFSEATISLIATSPFSGDLILCLTTIDASNQPQIGNILATSDTLNVAAGTFDPAVGTPTTFNFSTPMNLVAGTGYATVLKYGPSFQGTVQIMGTGPNNNTAFGDSFYSTDGGQTWIFHQDGEWYLDISNTINTPGIVDGQTICWDDAQQKFLPADKVETTTVPTGCFIAVDQKPNGSDGGNLARDVWTTRDLNTVTSNAVSWASLTGNGVELEAGCCYLIEASSPAYRSNRHRIRLFDIANNVEVALGTNEYNATTIMGSPSDVAQTRSFVCAEYCPTVPAIIEVQHYITEDDIISGQIVGGIGSSSSPGFEIPGDEIYTVIKVDKKTVEVVDIAEFAVPGIQDGQTVCWDAASGTFLPVDKTADVECFQLKLQGSPILAPGVAGVWNTYPLNFEATSASYAEDLGNGQFKLNGGCCYEVESLMTGLRMNYFTTRLFNVDTQTVVTNSDATVGFSDDFNPPSETNATAQGCTEVCITADTVFELQYFFNSEIATSNIAGPSLGGQTSVGGFLKVKKQRGI